MSETENQKLYSSRSGFNSVYRDTLVNYNLGELINLSQTQPRLLYYHGSDSNYYSVSPQNTHACFNHGTFTDLLSFLDTIDPQNVEKAK